jgi:hypothetical protein
MLFQEIAQTVVFIVLKIIKIMTDLTTISNGFVWAGEDRIFTATQIFVPNNTQDFYWIWSDTQVLIETNEQVNMFETTTFSVNGTTYTNTVDFVSALGL